MVSASAACRSNGGKVMNYPTAIVVATALIAAATVSVNLPAAQPAQGNPGQAKDALQKRMKLKNDLTNLTNLLKAQLKAQKVTVGRYVIGGTDGPTAWAIDSATGAVRWCRIRSASTGTGTCSKLPIEW